MARGNFRSGAGPFHDTLCKCFRDLFVAREERTVVVPHLLDAGIASPRALFPHLVPDQLFASSLGTPLLPRDELLRKCTG